MNNRLMQIDSDSFASILHGYKKINIPMRNCLDGGAGSGSTARTMLPYLEDSGKIYAF